MAYPPESWSQEVIDRWWDASGHYTPIFEDEIAQGYFYNGWYSPDIAIYHAREIREQMDEYMATEYGLDFSGDFFDWAAWREYMGY